MRTPVGVDWAGMTSADVVTGEATPPAQTTLLQQADHWPVAVATWPSIGCGHITGDGVTGNPATRWLALSIPPACARLRYYATQCSSDFSGVFADLEAATTTGGLTGADVATITALGGVRATLPHAIVTQKEFESGDWDDTAPGTAIDRMLELAESAQPAAEIAFIKNAQAFSLWVSVRTGDLESL
jgi:hypothetical protein